MIRYRFRDKLLLSFAVLLIVTFVPVLVLVNTQIDTISEAKIEQDLHGTRKVFRRFQQSQLVTLSERASTFVVTQPEIRAEIVNFAEELDDPKQFGHENTLRTLVSILYGVFVNKGT